MISLLFSSGYLTSRCIKHHVLCHVLCKVSQRCLVKLLWLGAGARSLSGETIFANVYPTHLIIQLLFRIKLRFLIKIHIFQSVGRLLDTDPNLKHINSDISYKAQAPNFIFNSQKRLSKRQPTNLQTQIRTLIA
jgi:hypothetical protein